MKTNNTYPTATTTIANGINDVMGNGYAYSSVNGSIDPTQRLLDSDA